MISGVSLTSAVTAGVIMAGIPAAVAVMSWLFLKEHISARTWFAVALPFLGLAFFRYQNKSIQRTVHILHRRKHLRHGMAWSSAPGGGRAVRGGVFSDRQKTHRHAGTEAHYLVN